MSRVKPGLWPGVCIIRGVVSQSLSFFLISRKIRLSPVKLELVIDFRPKFSRTDNRMFRLLVQVLFLNLGLTYSTG